MSLSPERKKRYAILFLIAALNDALDIVEVLNPLLELLLDVLTAALITFMLGELDPMVFAIAVLDAIPIIDLAPIWSGYIYYRYYKEVSATKPKLKLKKLELPYQGEKDEERGENN